MKRAKVPGKTRRFPIPPAMPHRDKKSDYRRRPKHPGQVPVDTM